VDNNLNGRIDCADDDCVSFAGVDPACALGVACLSNEQCSSGLRCLGAESPPGVCTRTCEDDRECPATLTCEALPVAGSACVSRTREVCNDVDDDLDGQTDEGVRVQHFDDADQDGWGSDEPRGVFCVGDGPEGSAALAGDCDDANAEVHPAAVDDTCDDVDSDCDGRIDEAAAGAIEATCGEGACRTLVTWCVGDAPPCIAGAPSIEDRENGIDDDCDGAVDECSPENSCLGPGVFVSAEVGSDASPGTMDQPVQTVMEGIRRAIDRGGNMNVHVARGGYLEDVVLEEGVSLWGGYEPAEWGRDPERFVSRITLTTSAGLLVPALVTGQTKVDGLTLVGRPGGDSSTVVTIQSDASPIFQNNVVEVADTAGASRGFYINPAGIENDARPVIRDNRIRMGGSGVGWGADQGGQGIASISTASVIVGNDVSMPSLTLSSQELNNVQRAIEVFDSPAPGAEVRRNRVRGTGTLDVAIAVRVGGGDAIVDHNDVDPGACLTLCIGISAEGDLGNVSIINNIAHGGRRGVSQMGLRLGFELAPSAPNVLVHSNMFGGGGETSGASNGVHIYLGTTPTPPVMVGSFYNNTIHSGLGAERYAFFEGHVNADPVVLSHNALFFDSSGSGSGGLYYDEAGDVLRTNAIELDAIPEGSNNFVSSCWLTFEPDADFHLREGSPCIDAGTDTLAPATDMDGDRRPMGSAHDVGVDEAPF
jgi:hypothetical protein